MIPLGPLLLGASFLLLPPAFPAGDALAEAEALLGAGRPAEARAALEAGLSAADLPGPERGRLQEALGRCLRAEGRPWDAEAAFGRALEADPGLRAAMLGRGEVYLDLAAGAAGADAPRGAEVRALAADALRWLRAADAALPGDRRTLAAVARARTLDLDFAGAAETLRSLLAKEGADPGLHHLLAAALRGAGDLEGAAAEEGTCLALDPARADAAALRAGDLAALGRVEEARAAALEGLLRVPTADSLYRALWQVDAPARRWAAAEEALLAVLAKHPDQPTALHYLGHLRISSGRIEDALQAFSRKAALEPGNPAPLLQVARLRVARSDLAGAEEAYGRVLELLGPGDGDLRAEILDGYYAVAAAHGVARRFSEAERLFRRLAALDPASASYRMFLGLSLRRLGRYPEAEAAYREAVDLAVFDGSARNDFGLLYLGWGRPADARREFLRSAEEDPRITAPLENLGLMAVAEGRREEARERFLEAHRRASSFRDEADRLKFRRYLDSLR